MDALSNLRKKLNGEEMTLPDKSVKSKALNMIAADGPSEIKPELGSEYYKSKHRERISNS